MLYLPPSAFHFRICCLPVFPSSALSARPIVSVFYSPTPVYSSSLRPPLTLGSEPNTALLSSPYQATAGQAYFCQARRAVMIISQAAQRRTAALPTHGVRSSSGNSSGPLDCTRGCKHCALVQACKSRNHTDSHTCKPAAGATGRDAPTLRATQMASGGYITHCMPQEVAEHTVCHCTSHTAIRQSVCPQPTPP